MPRFWSSPTTKDAYRLSIASIIVTIGAAIAGITFFVNTGSSLCLVYGLENCVDFISSVVVLWRFFAPSSLSEELEDKLRHREKRASIAISMILVLLGIGILGAAINDFRRGVEDVEDALQVIIGISFISWLVFAGLSMFKFQYANRLESPSLRKDGICSLIGTILAGALFVNTIIIEKNEDLWWLDPVVSMLCGFASIVIGIKALYQAKTKDQLPIFTLGWWLTSQGDGADFGKKASSFEMGTTDKGSDEEDGDLV